MLNTPFPPWPSFSEREADTVRRVLLSNRVNYWTGDEARNFEREYASWVGVSHAIALSNGTVALELALRSLGIGPGDEVIVTPRSFFASVSCVVATGARPIFADVDRDTQNLSAETIAPVVSARTRAVILVHLAGMPCDMDPILALARDHRLAVIEDCAQAHGARYRGRMVGSMGDVGSWSFCQDKIMTTGGEGGMITTSRPDVWASVWAGKDHGKSWHAVYEEEHGPGFKWLHESFGTNARMTEMQAAIGRIQLEEVDASVERRRTNAARIWAAARTATGLRVAEIPDWAQHAAYRAFVFVEPKALRSGWTRDRVMHEISALGVPCSVGTCPEVYRERAILHAGLGPREPLPIARELGETGIAFLVHPTLRSQDIDRTCEVLAQVMARACRCKRDA